MDSVVHGNSIENQPSAALISSGKAKMSGNMKS
jgi:hypothetical protein